MGELGYLAYLANRLPPGSLANAVKRRTLRRFRTALADVAAIPPPPDSSLMAAWRPVPSWADPRRADELCALAPRLPGFSERVLCRANRICLREFDVFGRTVRVAHPSEWTRDPVTGDTWPLTAPRVGQVSDPKRVWALARMDWAVTLGQAAWLSAGEDRARYVRAFAELAAELVRAAPAAEGILWATTMEVALRGANLATALTLLRGEPELAPERVNPLLRALWCHAAFTYAHLEDQGAVPNNHLVADLSGLFQMALLFPEMPGAAEWKRVAAAGLADQAEAQVLEDGMGFEGSVAYHRLLLELFLGAWCVTDEAPRILGPRFGATLIRMVDATHAYLSPFGEAPAVGDDDSGRGLALTHRPHRDHRYLANLGAALFGRGRAKCERTPGGTSIEGFPDEAAWLIGMRGYRAFLALRPAPVPRARALRSFGMASLTSGDRHLTLACCGNGQRGVGGHGHNDKLSLELWSGTRHIVVDAGTGTYADATVRDRFRSTALHSTVQVDGLEQSPWAANRVFALPDLAHAQLEGCEAREGVAFAEGVHFGYLRGSLGIRHRRHACLMEAADAALIVDDLAGDGHHRMTSRFHLPDTQARFRVLRTDELQRLEKLGSYIWRVDQALELGPEESPTALWVIAGPPGVEVALEPSQVSPGYDQRHASLCIEAEWRGALPLHLATAFLFHQPHSNGHPAQES